VALFSVIKIWPSGPLLVYQKHVSLLVFFLTLNLVISLADSVLAPMILSQTGNSSSALGVVQSAGALGAVLGSVLLTAWGGFRRRMKTLLLAEALTAIFGLILFALGRNLWGWAVASALGSAMVPFAIGSSQAIWQAKVAPDVQGRVFASRRLIAWIWMPVTPLLAGALADYVTEPAMQGQTGLAALFGGLVGTGPGSGMALQFLLAGVVYLALVVFVALAVPAVRDLEDLLPDHDQAPAPVQ
jgi:DHA3 family macrolide efflux protein-like MFS transporter